MHRSLQIVEVVENIVENVGHIGIGSYYDAIRSQDSKPHPLTAFALVCRSFYEPAMNVLWRTQDSIIPLVKCLPVDKREEDEYEVILHKVIGREDWGRFLIHASRVREFIMDLNADSELDLYRALTLYRPIMNLFPSLRTFALRQPLDGSECSMYAHLFFGPRLTSFESNINFDYTMIPILESLGELSPALRHFHALDAHGSRGRDVSVALSETICRMTNLRHFDAAIPLSASAMIHLAGLPDLQELTCNVKIQKNTTLLPSSPYQSSFASLQKLDLMVDISPPVITFIQSMEAPKLSELHLRLTAQPSTNILQSCLQAASNHSFLSTLVIVPADPRTLFTPDHLVNEETIRPLFRLQRLHTLGLARFPFNLNDESIRIITSALSGIQFLQLGNLACGLHSKVTLQGLLPFAERCGKLGHLGLVIDASTAPLVGRGMPGGRHRCPSLKFLLVGPSVINDPALVALFLSDIFPDARICWNTHQKVTAPVGSTSSWREVDRLKRLFGLAREQERESRQN